MYIYIYIYIHVYIYIYIYIHTYVIYSYPEDFKVPAERAVGLPFGAKEGLTMIIVLCVIISNIIIISSSSSSVSSSSSSSSMTIAYNIIIMTSMIGVVIAIGVTIMCVCVLWLV